MDMAKSNILIVEDEFIIALDFESRLMQQGDFTTKIVSSGEGAVTKAASENFDVIFMDIKLMGKMDGIEAAQIIQKKIDVPIVYISGNADLLESERLKQTHPAGILKKPVVDYEINEVLKIVCPKED